MWHLCLGWGLLAAQGFNLAGFAPHLALVSLWFERRRGTAAGLVLGGASLGALIIVPLTQYFVDLNGWRWTYTVLGVVGFLILAPLNALWQRHRPQDIGLHPEGATADPPIAATHAPARLGISHLLDILRTARFWGLFVSVCSIGWLSNITSVHQLAHMIDNGFADLLAASVIGLTGLLRAISSTLWGNLSDRFGREPILHHRHRAVHGRHRLPGGSGAVGRAVVALRLCSGLRLRLRRARLGASGRPPQICFRRDIWARFWASWNWAGA